MKPVFDGHNDALTRDESADLAQRHEAGDLDLPRMREGGMRGGIFAIFTPSAAEDSSTPLVNELETMPVGHATAAAHARTVAERLERLERAGELRIARTVADLDAAYDGSAPPAAVLHLEGAEAIDPGLEALEPWYAAGCARSAPSGAGPTASPTACPSPSPPHRTSERA